MTIIKEIPDKITVKNPFTDEVIEEHDGKIIGKNAFVSFVRNGIYWAWTLYEFDSPIVKGITAPKSGRNTTVNPDGFIYNGKIYKIEVQP